MPRIVVVGSINMDLVVRAPRLPRPGETVRGDDFHTIPGGKGANQAVAAARLGAETCMVGRIGDDDFGRRLRQGLVENGVDVTCVSADRERASGVALIIIQQAGENSIVVAGGANDALGPGEVEAAAGLLRAADAVLLQLEIPLESVAAAIGIAREAGALTVLDAGPARALGADLLRGADVLSPNLVEAETLLGHPVKGGLEAARELAALGAPACVVKSGKEGCAWATADAAGRFPAVPVEAVDTTAAGDAFTAALGVALAEGRDLEAAARWANFAGALAVTRLGAQPSMPTRAELEGFVSASGGG